MAPTESYQPLKEDHRNWLNQLNFFHDEIKFMQNRLAEVAAKDTNYKEFKSTIADYKYKFYNMLERIDEFRYSIYRHDKELAGMMELSNRTKQKMNVEEDHHTIKDQYERFVAQYYTLKDNFHHFLTTVQ